jgi:hypothetical protein
MAAQGLVTGATGYMASVEVDSLTVAMAGV